MHKKIIFTTVVIIIYLFMCNIIYNQSINNIKISTDNKSIITRIIPRQREKPIGKLIINKLNINNNIYNMNSKLNNVDKNITILKGSIEPTYNNSIMFIAAHSGNDDISYFKNLDKLIINDNITLIYKDKKYNYIINKIWEEDKNGYINVNKENSKQLILTTCSPNHNNKQLIINSTLKRVY